MFDLFPPPRVPVHYIAISLVAIGTNSKFPVAHPISRSPKEITVPLSCRSVRLDIA